MTQFRKQATGFAAVAGACVALTGTAFGVGGDDPLTSVTITSLPFADTGDTTTLTDQFDVVCPFSGSTSPDAWYNYTAPVDQVLVLTLCESAYDTKVYVLDSSFTDIACNDDACTSSGGGQFRSLLETGTITAGSQVFIGVDGWSGDAGVYDLLIEGQDPPEPCEIDCMGTDEMEMCDDSGATDTNGGCNSTPDPLFFDVNCGDTVCGTTWAFGGTRDTDWFRLVDQGADREVTYNVIGEFDSAYFFLGVDPDCATVVVEVAVNPGPCEAASIAAIQPAGSESWWFAGAGAFDGLPCGVGAPIGNDYQVSWSCSIAPCPQLGDTDTDGDVDFQDLLQLLANFGPCP